MALGDIAASVRTAFRKYVTDGVAASGPHQPVKDEIFTAGDTIEARVASIEALAATGLSRLAPVLVATTADGAFASAFDAGSAVDSVTLAAGDRILIKNQAAGATNGIYTVQASGAPVRAADADTADEVGSGTVYVQAGTANGGKTFACQQVDANIVLGTTPLTWVEVANEDSLNPRLDLAEQEIDDLQAAVAQETTDRIAADTAEATARADGDAAENAARVADVNAEEAARIAADAALQSDVDALQLFMTTNASGELVVQDNSGRQALVVRLDGTVMVGALTAKIITTLEGEDFVIQDGRGRIAFAVNPDGEVEVGKLTIASEASIAGVQLGGGEAAGTREVTFDRELLHVLIFGQSNGAGRGGEALLNVDPRFNAVSFNGGESAFNGGALTQADNRASLIPLVAKLNPGRGGETCGFGYAEAMGERLEAESGGDPATQGITLLLSNGSEGSQDSSEIGPTSPWFARLVDDITYGWARAQAEAMLYACDVTLMLHGESDDQVDTPFATYVTRIEEVRAELEDTYEAVTGAAAGSHPMRMLHWQVATHLIWGLAAPWTAQAQVTLHDTVANHHLFMPGYILEYDAGDKIHVDTAAWHHRIGLHAAIYAKRALYEGLGKYRIKPVSHVRTTSSGVANDTVIVTYDVPVPPLVFDTEQVLLNTNYGFALYAADGVTPIVIEDVKLLGSKKLLVRAAAAIPAGAKLRYAFYGDAGNTEVSGRRIGPRGNLRDSQGDSVRIGTLKNGTVRIDNWAFAEEYTLT